MSTARDCIMANDPLGVGGWETGVTAYGVPLVTHWPRIPRGVLRDAAVVEATT
jgi:hypothetical protein